jgi:hypothetical protein
MDFGFAPGVTQQDVRVRLLFDLRGGTTRIPPPPLATVQEFVGHLGGVSDIDNLLLGVHATNEVLKVPMFPNQRGETEYETLEASLTDTNKSIAIPDVLLPPDPTAHFFHIKGCNIGTARPFLVKLKQALGNKVKVTAPKHFHGLATENGLGLFEFMAREFIIRRLTRFASRRAAVTAFQNAGFTLLDGTPVPANSWERWIPKKIGKTRKPKLRVRLGVAIGGIRTIPIPFEFRVDPKPFKDRLEFTPPTPFPPPSEWQARFRQSIRDDPRFSTAPPNPHPYPFHVRLGYPTVDAFFAGYRWKHSRKGRFLKSTGSRVKYTAVVPITNAAGNLIFGFYPNPGTGHAPIPGPAESDRLFYEEV